MTRTDSDMTWTPGLGEEDAESARERRSRSRPRGLGPGPLVDSDTDPRIGPDTNSHLDSDACLLTRMLAH